MTDDVGIDSSLTPDACAPPLIPHALLHALPIGIIVANEQNKVTYVNKGWCDMSQRSAESALGENWKDLIHPDDLDEFLKRSELFWNGSEGLETEPYTFRQLMPAGPPRWFQLQTAAQHDTQGRVVNALFTLTDVTALKLAERSVQALHTRLQAILETNTIGVWEFVFASEQLFWNDQMFEIYGTSREHFNGRYEDWSARVHPDDKLSISELLPRSVDGNSVSTSEFRIIRPDGEVRHIYSTVYLTCDEDEKSVRAVGVNLDITAQRELEKTRESIERITDNVPCMLYQFVRSGAGAEQVSYVSPHCFKLFEVHPDDVLGDIEKLYQFVHVEDIDKLKDTIRHSARDLSPFKLDYRLTLPEQGVCWRRVVGNPSRNDHGDTIWDSVVFDITQTKEAEQELQIANTRLARATNLKDEFLANMSHELRTPLNAILGMTEVLQEGIAGAVTQQQLEGLQVIRQSGDHLLQLINEVLDLAKVESGSMKLEKSSVSVKSLCESSLQMIAQHAHRKSIELRQSVPYSLARFSGDEKRLRQILVNLLGNAVKFTQEGGRIVLKVGVTDQDQGQYLCFCVQDNGIGMQPSKVKDMFEPFVQADRGLNKRHQGTGLGLPLVKQFTELHGGHVVVESKPGEGSCFAVYIPFLKVDGPEDAQAADQLRAHDHCESSGAAYAIKEALPFSSKYSNGGIASSTSDSTESVSVEPDKGFHDSDSYSNRVRTLQAEETSVEEFARSELAFIEDERCRSASASILLAEDNPDIALTTKMYLQSAGFDITVAGNGEQAVALSDSQSPDLILMDIQMPDVDGLTAIRTLRSRPAMRGIPIVAMTGFAAPSDETRCLRAGADLFISKPYSMGFLLNSIQALLNR